MISSMLKSDGSKDGVKIAKRNKVMVKTTFSTDGHYTESLYIDYNPEESFSLFLLEDMLNSSTSVDFYMVFDENGVRIKGFDAVRFPKRV